MKLFELIETNSITDQNIDRSINNIKNKLSANPEKIGIAQQGLEKLKDLYAKATGQQRVAEDPAVDPAMANIQVSPAVVNNTIQQFEQMRELASQLPDGPVKKQMEITLKDMEVNFDREKRAYGDEREAGAIKGLDEFLVKFKTGIDKLAGKLTASEQEYIKANQDSTTKKIQKSILSKQSNIKNLTTAIEGIFSGEVFQPGALTNKDLQDKIIKFITQATEGIIDWGDVLEAGKDKKANIDSFVPAEFKEIYQMFKNQLFNARPPTTAGAWGPGEVGLILIGNPITKADDGGDLQDSKTGEKFELKASRDERKGGRLSPNGLGTSNMRGQFKKIKIKYFGKDFETKLGDKYATITSKNSLNQTFINELNRYVLEGNEFDTRGFLYTSIAGAFTNDAPDKKELNPYVEPMVGDDNTVNYNVFVRNYAKFLFSRYQGKEENKKFKNIIVFNPGTTTYTVLDGADDIDRDDVTVTGGIEFGGDQVPKSPQIGIS